MSVLLDVQSVQKTYGSKSVVKDVSFQAKAGQIMGILGPNGAGKTTTIRMIMGITLPDSGKVIFHQNGSMMPKVPRSRIGYLPEERGLYKEARVMEILLFLSGLKDLPKPVARKRAMEWLEKFDLGGHANSKIEQLSKGMAQKVQFISSILHEPQLIILDEPFSGLDPVSQDVFKEEIRNLAKRGTAILLSSHQMNIVEELCNQIFLIHQGQKVVSGTMGEIKELHGNYRVHIYSENGLGGLENSPLVAKQTRDDAKWTLNLKEQVTPAQFLSTIPEDAPISELSISRASLHDIFVKIAKGGDHQ